MEQVNWTPDEAMMDAARKHPECKHAEWDNGVRMAGIGFRMTIVVKLWRTEECYLEGDPPRHVCEGYDAGR